MQTAVKVILACCAAANILAACAVTDVRPVPGAGGGDDGRGRGLPNLFISPSGEPFRADADQPYPLATWFARADTNHDGRLTQAEFRADAAAFFKRLDTNHDGVVDGFEVQHYEQVIAPEINPQVEGLRFGEGMDLSLGQEGRGIDLGGAGRGGREEAGDQRPEGAGLFGLLNEPEPVAATDFNFDGHITLQEFLMAADRRFQALDKKRQGYLTLLTLGKTPVQQALERSASRRAKGAKHP